MIYYIAYLIYFPDQGGKNARVGKSGEVHGTSIQLWLFSCSAHWPHSEMSNWWCENRKFGSIPMPVIHPKVSQPSMWFQFTHEPRARPRSTLATLASWTSFSRLLVAVGSDLPQDMPQIKKIIFTIIHHLVIKHGNGKIEFLIGKSPINGPYVIAMFDHRMVYRSVAHQ